MPDSEDEMVIDERTESERTKQQKKDVPKKRSKPELNQAAGTENLKILGTVQILENEPTELCTVSVNDDDVSRPRSSQQSKQTGKITYLYTVAVMILQI